MTRIGSGVWVRSLTSTWVSMPEPEHCPTPTCRCQERSYTQGPVDNWISSLDDRDVGSDLVQDLLPDPAGIGLAQFWIGAVGTVQAHAAMQDPGPAVRVRHQVD